MLAAGILLARRAHFCGEIEEIVIVYIDVKQLRSEVRYEDADGHYVKNQELAEFADQ